MSITKDGAKFKILQFKQSQVLECPLCPDQKREGIEDAGMTDGSNRD